MGYNDINLLSDSPVGHLLPLGVELPVLLRGLVDRPLRHLVAGVALVELGLAPRHPLPRRHHLQVLLLHPRLVRVLAPVMHKGSL